MPRFSTRTTVSSTKVATLIVFLFFGFIFLISSFRSNTRNTNHNSVTSYTAPQEQKEQQQQQQQLQQKPCVQIIKCDEMEQLQEKSNDGQINMNTSFGKALYALARQSDVKKVLELGTWYGGGSTMSIAKGMKESGDTEKRLTTLEIFEPAWDYARKKMKKLGLPVVCLLGGTVPTEQYLKPNEVPDHDQHYQLYYERDLELSKEREPLLEPLCMARKYDLVLIDGNEYTGWAEYKVIDEHCKPKYLALHDMGTLKTKRVEEEISSGRTVWKVYKTGNDAAKWGIFVRKDYNPPL